MIAQSNVTHMIVGKDLDILGSTKTRDDLAVGQIGVFKVGSSTANGASALSAGDRYTIATKNQDGVIVETPIITFGSGTPYNVDYSAPAKESKAIGYNGTSGSIDASNSTDYVAHFTWRDNSKTFGCNNQPVKFAAYRSDASATQLEIATGLAESFNKNFSYEDPKLMKAEILSAGASVALGTSVNTVTMTNGSKYFTASDIDDSTGGGTALAVGDYLRIPTGTSRKVTLTGTSGTANIAVNGTNYLATFDTDLDTTASNFVSTHGTTLSALGITVANPSGAVLTFTSSVGVISTFSIANATGDSAGTLNSVADTSTPVYKITALNTTSNIGTLSMAYQGEDIVYDDLELKQVESSAAIAGAAGVKVSALDSQKYFEPGIVKYDILSFKIQLNEDFGSTDTSDLTAGKRGSGSYYEVAQNEWFLKGNRGESWRNGNYPKNVKLESTSGKTYDQVFVNFAEANAKTIDRSVYAYGGVLIATEDAGSGNIYASLKTVLGL